MRMGVICLILCLLVSAALITRSTAAPDRSTMTIAFETSVATLDNWYGTETNCHILTKLWGDTLFEIDPQEPAKLVPLLATSWKYLNPTTLEVKLRRGVKFHNGEPFNAAAVKFSLEYIVDEKNAALPRYAVNWLKQVDVVDEYTVRLIYLQPNAPSLQRLTQLITIHPPEYYTRVKSAQFGQKPVGTGPYRVVNFVRDREVVLEANRDYFDGPKGKPEIQRIVVRFLPELATRVGELLRGSVDVITEVPSDQAEIIKASGKAVVHPVRTNTMVYLNLDGDGRSGPSPLQKLPVRRAIAHAIDRDAIANRILGGYATRLDAMATPFMFGYTDKVTKYDYSPDTARRLLAEAGVPDGFETELYSWVPNEQAMVAVIGYLRAVGIKVAFRYTPNDTSTFRRIMFAGKAPMNIDLWTTVFDADAVLNPHLMPGAVRSYNSHPDIGEWLATAASSVNAAQRRELYSRILKKVAENAYMIPLYSPQSVYAAGKGVDFTRVPTPLYPRYYGLRWK